MLILLFSIFITLIILGIVLYFKFDSDISAGISGATCAVSAIGAFIIGTLLIIVGIDVSGGIIIDDKINLYESENTKIDKQVCFIVENYKDYEKETFKNIKNKNANTLVSLYPELKSDTLVKEQIKIYNSNRKKIIKLKQEKLEQKPKRWWLYFGT